MTTKLPGNDKYKPSGVVWLGEIPEGWEITSVKHVLEIPICDGPHTTPQLYDEGIPFVSAEAIKNGEVDFEKIRGFISLKDHLLFSKKYSPKRNDIYMVKSGATTGNVAIVKTDIEFSIWSPLAVFRANQNKVIPNYLFYYLESSSFKVGVELSWSFGTQQNIGMGVLSNLPIAYPSIDEQIQIAQFLGSKTALINQAIGIKEKQIELLKERRQILIHLAVTRGLNPNVTMKDSGVEWIGEVPEGWEVKRLKNVSEVQSGVTLGKTYVGKNLPSFPYLRVANVQAGFFKLDEVAEISLPSNIANKYFVRKGDILVTEGGDLDKLGRGTVWAGEIENCLHQNHIFAIRITSSIVSTEYTSMIMESDYGRKYFTNTANKTTNLASTNSTKLGNFPLIIPPKNIQESIIKYVRNASLKIATAIALKQQEIEKLKEYKATLINSAVTGKVKVV